MLLTSDTSTGTTPLGLSEATAADYIALLKPRVMSLVVFTAFVGLVMAPGVAHPTIAVVAILAIAVGAGASGALNMWYDADIDAVMSRTAKRPIPAGRVSRDAAFAATSSSLIRTPTHSSQNRLVGWSAYPLETTSAIHIQAERQKKLNPKNDIAIPESTPFLLKLRNVHWSDRETIHSRCFQLFALDRRPKSTRRRNRSDETWCAQSDAHN